MVRDAIVLVDVLLMFHNIVLLIQEQQLLKKNVRVVRDVMLLVDVLLMFQGYVLILEDQLHLYIKHELKNLVTHTIKIVKN